MIADEQIVTTRTLHPPSVHAPVRMSIAARLFVGLVAFGPLMGIALAFAVGTETSAGIGIGTATLFWTTTALLLHGGYLFGARFSAVQQVGWGMGLLFAAPIVLPVFWVRHVLFAPRAQVSRPKIIVTRVARRRERAPGSSAVAAT